MHQSTTISRILPLLLLVGLSACGSKVEKVVPTELSLQVQASDSINTNADGSSAPMVILMFELSGSGKFESSDFFSLYEDKPTVLGTDLIAREEQNLTPNKLISFKRELHPSTRYIGVVGAFRDIDTARWRILIPVTPNAMNSANISVDKNKMSLGSK